MIPQGWRTRVLNWGFLALAAFAVVPIVELDLPKWVFILLLFFQALANLILREHTTTPAGTRPIAAGPIETTITNTPTPLPVAGQTIPADTPSV